MSNNIRVGRIYGSPLNGLCERICVEVKRVFDGCIERSVNKSFDGLTLTDFSPNTFVSPLTLLRAYSASSAQISGLTVTQAKGDGFLIRYVAELPLAVEMTDLSGAVITARTTLSEQRQTVLKIPTDGRDYSVEVTAGLTGRTGMIGVDNQTLRITGCLAFVTRIIVNEDIIIPTYGRCVYPTCRSEEDVCDGLFAVPPFN